MTKDIGRPTKFTEETRQGIYNALDRGATYALAARLVGIAEGTLYMWLRNARELQSSDKDDFTTEELELISFIKEFDRRESEYLTSLIEDVGKSNKQWMLTKRMKSEFGDVTNINLNGNIGVEHSWKELVIDTAKNTDNENE